MPSATAPNPFSSREAWSRVIRAGVATAIIDGLFSSILTVVAYRSTVSRLFQGVASTLLGSGAFTGGGRTTALGMLMHCGVAFAWSAFFVFVVMRSPRIDGILTTRYGGFGVASVYGPAIWLVMSLLVIPGLLHRPPTISIRWWVQLVGHFPFVGIPIVLSAARGRRADRAPNDRARGDRLRHAD
jgi:hypothetical protein